jgi:hypothetical protein
VIPGHVEPAFSRDLLATLWNEGHLVWAKPFGDREHPLSAGHLKVEHGTDLPCQTVDVVVLNVPAVLAEMCGDAVGPRALAERGRGHRVGLTRVPRLTHGGHVVDVDIEALVPKASRGDLAAGCRSGVWHVGRLSHVQTHTGVEIEPS